MLRCQKLEDAVRFASQRKNTKQLEQLHREVSEYRETVAKQYSEEHNIWVRPLPKEVTNMASTLWLRMTICLDHCMTSIPNC